MDLLREFHGPNAGYVIALYEQYLEDPDSVDAATRELFSRHVPSLDGAPSGGPSADFPRCPADIDQIVFIANLAQNVREYGHLGAHLDPLADPRYFPYSVFATEDDTALGDPLTELELQAQGVPMVVVDYSSQSWQDIATELGRITGHAKEAAAAIARFDAPGNPITH